MADEKISAMPDATAPLGGTELVPLVQGGANVKVTATNFTAGRTISATGVLAANGTNSAPTYSFAGFPTYGMYFGSNGVTFTHATTPTVNVRSNNFVLGSLTNLAWSAAPSADNNTTDLLLARDAANTLGIRNGTAAQVLNVYATRTDALNYSRIAIKPVAGTLELAAESAGSGSANIDIKLTPKGTGLVQFGAHATIGAETVTGYISIKDASGVTRKVAVVS
jgi:hypothetical protein